MNVRFSKLAVLAVVAACLGFANGQPAKTTPASELAVPSNSKMHDPGGQALVQAATSRIAGRDTIDAKLRVRADLLAQPLVGSGRYAQLKATSGLLLRMELVMQAGGHASSVKQICSGPDLWEHWRLGNQEKLHHTDLRRVQQGLSQQPGENLGMASLNLARGGLPKLLSQLERNFDFSRSPPKTDDFSGVEMWVVTGVWKLNQLKNMAPEAAENGAIILKKLPRHLPHQVEIHFGQGDLFPYRITYQQWSPQDGPEGGIMMPTVTTEFYGVALDDPLDPAQFNYQQPNNVSLADRTDAFLQSLGIAKRPNAAQQR